MHQSIESGNDFIAFHRDRNLLISAQTLVTKARELRKDQSYEDGMTTEKYDTWGRGVAVIEALMKRLMESTLYRVRACVKDVVGVNCFYDYAAIQRISQNKSTTDVIVEYAHYDETLVQKLCRVFLGSYIENPLRVGFTCNNSNAFVEIVAGAKFAKELEKEGWTEEAGVVLELCYRVYFSSAQVSNDGLLIYPSGFGRYLKFMEKLRYKLFGVTPSEFCTTHYNIFRKY